VTGGALIMVVDDDEDVREITQILFEAVGYRVRAAEDGLEAWREICLGERPALILLDLMMPGMDGEQFIRTLRESPMLDIPVVVISGHSAAREKARQLGANDCLTKPIDLDELLALVRRFVPGQAAHGDGSAAV
jgi:CheY-like chemotaxis protein